MRRAVTTLGLLIGIVGLVLQFIVSIDMSLDAGRSLPGAIEYFFSFFTVLTNIGLVLVYAAALSGKPAWFARPRVRGGLLVAIVVVSITYAAILAQLWTPQGLFFIADTTLHYVAPVVFVVWWFLFGRSGTSRLADMPYWLIYPLAYLIFAMVRGAVIGQYPYPFLDLATNGAASVAISTLVMLALFAAVAAFVIWADRTLPAPDPGLT